MAQMETQTVDGIALHRPSVKLLVNYDHQMRKEVVDQMNEGQEMADQLQVVIKNADLRERHFSTPLAVSSAAQSLEGGRGKETRTESTSHTLLQKGERGRKVKMVKESTKASTRENSCIPQHQMGGSYASLGTTRQKDARVDATEFMHAAFAFQLLMLRLNIVVLQKLNSLLLEELVALDRGGEATLQGPLLVQWPQKKDKFGQRFEAVVKPA